MRLRRDDAARPDVRLADERGDLPGTLGEQRAERLDVHDADVDNLVDEVPAVASLHRPDPDQRRPPAVHPVVAELARHDHPLLGSADDVPVAADELGGSVDRIRSARTQEDDRVRDRRQIGEALCEGDRRLRRVRPERRVRRQPDQLGGNRVGDLLPPIANVAVPQRGGRVEVSPAVHILEPNALGRANHDLVGRDRVHVGKAVPEAAHGTPSTRRTGSGTAEVSMPIGSRRW